MSKRRNSVTTMRGSGGEAHRKEGREVRGHNAVLGGKVIIPRNEIDSAVEEEDTKH